MIPHNEADDYSTSRVNASLRQSLELRGQDKARLDWGDPGGLRDRRAVWGATGRADQTAVMGNRGLHPIGRIRYG